MFSVGDGESKRGKVRTLIIIPVHIIELSSVECHYHATGGGASGGGRGWGLMACFRLSSVAAASAAYVPLCRVRLCTI